MAEDLIWHPVWRSARGVWLMPSGFVILVVLFTFLRPVPFWPRPLPDFESISVVAERQAAFFVYLDPYLQEVNREVVRKRVRLMAISGQFSHGPLNRREDWWVRSLAAAHGLEIHPDEVIGEAQVRELLKRVDIIPRSLALAQAALESGWGTSRFARQGNNLFGTRCYSPGCGIVPERRPPGATFEVKQYRSPKASFFDYLRNLNSNQAYAPFWQIRESLRQSGEPLTGVALADGLYRYSSEGWDYVGKLQQLMQSHNLVIYDEPID